MAIEKLLSSDQFFKDLRKPHLELLKKNAFPKILKKRGVLFHEGDAGTSLYLLERGSIRLYKTSAAGKEIDIRIVKPGERFGEAILFEQECYPVTASALQECRLYALPKKAIHELLSDAAFRLDFLKGVFKTHHYLVNKITYLTALTVEERLVRFLAENYGRKENVQPGMSKKEMAAAIGTIPETFSRLLLRLKKEKLLSWERGSIRISPRFWETQPE